MKRILAVLCLAIALPGVVSARPTVPIHPCAAWTITRIFSGVFGFLRTHWYILPEDGGVTLPPPH